MVFFVPRSQYENTTDAQWRSSERTQGDYSCILCWSAFVLRPLPPHRRCGVETKQIMTCVASCQPLANVEILKTRLLGARRRPSQDATVQSLQVGPIQ